MSTDARPTTNKVGRVVSPCARLRASFSYLGLLTFSLVWGSPGLSQTVVPSDSQTELSDSPTVDPHFADRLRQAAREEQEKFRTRIPLGDAVAETLPLAGPARNEARRKQAAAQPRSSSVDANLAVGLSFLACLLTGTLAIRKLAPGLFPALNEQFNPWVTGLAPGTEAALKVRAEDDSMSEFLAAFQAGPSDFVGDESVRAEVLKAFYEKTPRTLETFRSLLQEIDRTTDEGGRQKILDALRWEMRAFRSEAGVPELLLVWQLAYALESLLKQLNDNLANVTPSTLRTLAGALGLIDELCHPGLETNLLTREPLKLLAVDDDPISRKAVSLALKRALNEPEIAADGKTALALAARQAYDVVFIDVEMPGMDGFEVCSKLHQTELNRYTPVVFVTGHSDFESRARAMSSGGSDLIGKPFLTFEITVKALTLALRGRMAVSAPPAVASQESTLTREPESVSRTRADELLPPEPAESQEIATEFLTRASTHLAPLRESFQAIFNAPDEKARQELLADVFLRIHSFTPAHDLPAVHPAIQLSTALDGLLRKLLENPQNVRGSILVTLTAAVELLDDLCALPIEAEVSGGTTRILVVDDDPVARRVLTGTLQLTFAKPDSADNGKAALALVEERAYDVIFLDAVMPELDGFEVCSRIRQGALNRTTPVVLVSSHSDGRLRAQIADCGGTAFVAKPFLVSEITLKALTFALRGWLEKREQSQIQLNGNAPFACLA